jgi:hypothetical protein
VYSMDCDWMLFFYGDAESELLLISLSNMIGSDHDVEKPGESVANDFAAEIPDVASDSDETDVDIAAYPDDWSPYSVADFPTL